jgi:hypothetical protein
VLIKIFASGGTNIGGVRLTLGRLIPLPLSTGHTGRSCGDAGCALFLVYLALFSHRRTKRSRPPAGEAGFSLSHATQIETYEAAARGVRIRELRWKNSAWLTTADTIAG